MSEEPIQGFWAFFEEHRGALVTPVARKVMDDALTLLRRVDRRFYYHIGERDEGVDLILSAEGHCDALPLLRRVRDCAPSLPGWRVLAVFDGDLTIGRRNAAVFPADENGDVLLRMARAGDDLCLPRAIDFSVVFPTARARRKFLASLEEEGLSGTPEEGGHRLWDVTVTVVLLPTHANITTFERRLEFLAIPFDGRNDGWGCFQQPER